ncbi:conserved protein of unknown function [Methylocella tundrae]|uniref:Uncharacterized protein n=1 Tax=Methylocella tundrae TaxID=227605 RepID=A0A4U8Z417_METTU|nr:conserved protein of unknown function [Methylocella tundrae]
MRSGLRLNSARDIEHRALLLDIDRAASPELTGVRRRRRVPVGHREDDVGFVLAREGELDDLLERDRAGVHRARPRIDDDLEGQPRGDEPLDTGLGQIDQFAMLDQPVFTAGDFKEDPFAVCRLGEAIEDCAADDRLAPEQLVVVEGQLEVAVGQEGDEPLGAALTQVERLVEPHLLEIARRQDRDEAVTAPRVECPGLEQLAAERHGIAHYAGLEIKIALREEKAIPPRRTQRPAFAQGVAEIVVVNKLFGAHKIGSLGFGRGSAAALRVQSERDPPTGKVRRTFFVKARRGSARR